MRRSSAYAPQRAGAALRKVAMSTTVFKRWRFAGPRQRSKRHARGQRRDLGRARSSVHSPAFVAGRDAPLIG